MNKNKILFDGIDSRDHSTIKRTDIIINDHETGVQLFRGSNKVVTAGGAFTAAKHFNIKPKIFTPSYNEILKLENSVVEPYDGPGIRKEELVFLFALGTDGCGQQNSDVYPVKYNSWIKPENLVPFRYTLNTNDISNYAREKYFGRKVINNRIAYYFKAFDNQDNIEIKQQYSDGTPIDENIYIAERADEVETIVELHMSVSKGDCREFFLATTGINDARVNTISLLTAWRKEIDGFIYYQDIRPLTKLNFSNESLIDPDKGLDFTYLIYY